MPQARGWGRGWGLTLCLFPLAQSVTALPIPRARTGFPETWKSCRACSRQQTRPPAALVLEFPQSPRPLAWLLGAAPCRPAAGAGPRPIAGLRASPG